jgi:hypothetical protein
LCTDGFQLADDFPETFLVENSVDAAPAFGAQGILVLTIEKMIL